MSRNHLAARAIRRHARTADEQREFLEMCGLWTADGSVPPDDDMPRRVSDLEPAGGSWAGWEGE